MVTASTTTHDLIAGWDPGDPVQRRTVLEILAFEPTALSTAAEELGVDPLPLILQAIALELVRTSVLLEQEVMAHLSEHEAVVRASAQLQAGLLGIPGPVEGRPGDEPQALDYLNLMRRFGQDVREALFGESTFGAAEAADR